MGSRSSSRPASSRPTSSDVAQAAGVSRSAVSFAFNSPSRLSVSTRDRILACAEDLGYSPSPLGRMLQAGQTRSLGVLLPQTLSKILENPYYSRFLMAVGQVCDEAGLTLLLTPPLRNSMVKAIPYAAVDGFIVCGLQEDRGEVAELRRRGIPFVLVDSNPSPDVPSVDVDDEQGAFDVLQHVLQLGHRRIAILSIDPEGENAEPDYLGPIHRRFRGAERALVSCGLSLQDVAVVEVPCTRMGGYQATKTLMTDFAPTAIVAFSDILAFGAIGALDALGISVPQQVSVTGFDDLPEAAWLQPRLTTVRQPIVAKGRAAADFLVAAIRDQDQHPRQLLGTTLIVRDSTRSLTSRAVVRAPATTA